jgi:hypothetical protein
VGETDEEGKIIDNSGKSRSFVRFLSDKTSRPLIAAVRYQCDLCTLLCGSELSYWFHRRTEHKVSSASGARDAFSMSLSSQVSLLSAFDEQCCKPCVITKFDSEWSFFNHMMNKHGGFQYRCPVCKKGYNKNFMLKVWFLLASLLVKKKRDGFFVLRTTSRCTPRRESARSGTAACRSSPESDPDSTKRRGKTWKEVAVET